MAYRNHFYFHKQFLNTFSVIHYSHLTSLLTYVLMNVLCIKELLFECINSSPPSAAYMCQWIGSVLVQRMACHLFGTKPLSKPTLCCRNLRIKHQWIFIQNTCFIHENASENVVCENGGHFVRVEMSWKRRSPLFRAHTLGMVMIQSV